jgi:hypothetical protein
MPELGGRQLALQVLRPPLPGEREDGGHVDTVVPGIERPHHGELGHPLPVGADGRRGECGGLTGVDLQVPGRYDHAHG